MLCEYLEETQILREEAELCLVIPVFLRNLLAEALFAVLHAALQRISEPERIQFLIPSAPRAWSHALYGPGNSEVIAGVSDSSLDNCFGDL